MMKRSLSLIFSFCIILCFFIPLFSLSMSADSSSEWHNLPSEYQEVEYLVITAAGPYVNTGIDSFSSPYLNVFVDFEPTNSYFSGSFLGYGKVDYVGFDLKFNNKSFNISGGYSASSSINLSSSQLSLSEIASLGRSTLAFHFDASSASIILNSNRLADSAYSSSFSFPFSLTGPLYLFACNSGSNSVYTRLSYCNFYSMSIYEGSELTHHYIPCYRVSDHKGGVYDLSTSSFLPNVGSSEFSFGPDVIPPPAILTPVVFSSPGLISWDTVDNAASYSYEIYSDSLLTDLVGSYLTTSTSLSVSASGFYFRVKATSPGFTDSPWSNVVLTQSPVMSQLDPPLCSVDHLFVSWSAVENASSYTVEVFSDSSLSDRLSVDSVTSTSFDVGAAGLYVRVKSSASGYIDSDWSNVVHTYIDPPAPIDLTPPVLSYSNGVLSWSTPDSDLGVSYVVIMGYNTPVYSGQNNSFEVGLSGTYYVFSYLSGSRSDPSNTLTVEFLESESDAYYRGYEQGQKDIQGLILVINALWAGFVTAFDLFTANASIGGITLMSILVSLCIIAVVAFVIKLIAKG